ncbi:hypothetical protein [Nonomuraea jabiensis]|uniref:hypothetical protein n=1 Tax=Nonomuraea jabiensis TaxID=882448 RepID=UPI003D74902E
MAKIDGNIVILLDDDRTFTYGTVRACAFVQNNGLHPGRETGAILDPDLDADDDWAAQYRHLENRCAVAHYVMDAPEDLHTWGVEYSQQRSITEAHTEIMSKTLRKIRREMSRLDEKLGYADSFGAYVARFASTIGRNKFGRKMQEPQPDGTYYRWFNVNAMSRHIPEMVKPQLPRP